MRVALDTNILAHAEGVNGIERRDRGLVLVRGLPRETTVIPVQVLGELFNVLTRKGGRSPAEAREAFLGWRDTFPVAGTSPEVMLTAMDLATDHQFSIWDAVIISVASRAGCRLLRSDDLQDGFTYDGVTVVNPFTLPRHALLDALLNRGDMRK